MAVSDPLGTQQLSQVVQFTRPKYLIEILSIKRIFPVFHFRLPEDLIES